MAVVINGSGTVTGLSVGGLPDGTVDAGTLADDAVGLAQMASGTDGNLITYDASGNPATVAVGTSGQVLTSNGAGNAPSMQTVSGNTPSFHAQGSDSVSPNTWTKLSLTSEQWDTDSAFDSSTNYRFTVPSGEAGKYALTVSVWSNGMNGGDKFLRPRIYKNGSAVQNSTLNYNPTTGNGELTALYSITVSLAESDYIEFYVRQNDGVSNTVYSYVDGFKLAGV